jgi:hypothetical protein
MSHREAEWNSGQEWDFSFSPSSGSSKSSISGSSFLGFCVSGGGRALADASLAGDAGNSNAIHCRKFIVLFSPMLSTKNLEKRSEPLETPGGEEVLHRFRRLTRSNWMNRESFWERERIESSKSRHWMMERGIELARPGGPIARARAGGRHRKKSQVVRLFARLSTVSLKLLMPSSILLPLQIWPLHNLDGIVIRQIESSRGTAIRIEWELAFAFERWARVGERAEGAKQRGG